MKYLKMLGLAVIAAAALMAFLGAGTASATVICKVEPKSGVCPEGSDYPAGTKGKASLKRETKAVLETTSGETLATCTESTVEGTSKNTGGATETVESTLTSLTWGGCSTKVVTLRPGLGQLHWIAGTNNGTLTTAGVEVTTGIFGVSCVYGAGALPIDAGTTVGGDPGSLAANTIVNKTEGGFLCPSTLRFTASYVATEPTAAWVAER